MSEPDAVWTLLQLQKIVFRGMKGTFITIFLKTSVCVSGDATVLQLIVLSKVLCIAIYFKLTNLVVVPLDTSG